MILRYWINSKMFSPATPRSYRENVMEACHYAPYAKLYGLEEPSIELHERFLVSNVDICDLVHRFACCVCVLAVLTRSDERMMKV